LQGSIYSIFQPYGAAETPVGEPFVPNTELPNPMDISGRFNTSAPHLVQLDDSNGTNGRLHYANASYYRHLWCVRLFTCVLQFPLNLASRNAGAGTTTRSTAPTRKAGQVPLLPICCTLRAF
jgi:hypothetical protein